MMSLTYLVIMLYAVDGSGIGQIETAVFQGHEACLTALRTVMDGPQDRRLKLQIVPFCVDSTTGLKVDEAVRAN